MLTTDLHLVLRLRMHGALSPLPHMPSWHGAELSTGLKSELGFRDMHRCGYV